MRTLAILSLGAALFACDSVERRDAAIVISAVARFRAADPASTPAAVEALKATPCSDPEVCSAKAACVVAGDAIAKSLQLKAEVQAGLNALESGKLARDSSEARALPVKLDAAEVLLNKGHDSLPACDEPIRALKRKYRI